MGSLFDGIGGFPLAASRHGIKTLWASEIEAFPMAVTKLHFPHMIHVVILQSSKGGSFLRWTSSQAVPHVRIFLWPAPNGWDSPEKDPVCLWSKSESLRR